MGTFKIILHTYKGLPVTKRERGYNTAFFHLLLIIKTSVPFRPAVFWSSALLHSIMLQHYTNTDIENCGSAVQHQKAEPEKKTQEH